MLQHYSSLCEKAHYAQIEGKSDKAQHVRDSQDLYVTGQRYFEYSVTANQQFVTITFMKIKKEKAVNEEINYSNEKGDL